MPELIPIDILAHADYAGRLKKTKSCPGMAAFGTLIDSIRDENPEETLLLDAGDEFCVNHWGGKPVVKALELLKTDAMTLGNHEFDWGRDFLENCIAQANYPILCANIVEKETGALVRGAKPWVMLERRGVKIGVLGLTTEYTPYMVTASAFAPYEARSALEAAAKYLLEMRKEGAQITIVLAHFPFYIDEEGNISGELYDALSNMPPVDAFVGGHIPGDYADVVLNAAVLKGGFAGVSLPHARLWFDPQANRVVRRECRVHLARRDAPVNEIYRAYADEVCAPFAAYFDEVLGQATQEWELHLAHETKLGNFLADCMLHAAHAQVAYMNATTAGGKIVPGPVTREDVLAVTSFNDPIYTTRMSGKQLWDLFELVYVPERFGNNAGFLFSGLIVHVDHTKPASHKIQKITLRDGTPLDMEKSYAVVSSEYMSSGGNDTAAIANQVKWEKQDILFPDAIYAYIKKHGTLVVSPEQRLHEIGEPENNNAPF